MSGTGDTEMTQFPLPRPSEFGGGGQTEPQQDYHVPLGISAARLTGDRHRGHGV